MVSTEANSESSIFVIILHTQDSDEMLYMYVIEWAQLTFIVEPTSSHLVSSFWLCDGRYTLQEVAPSFTTGAARKEGPNMYYRKGGMRGETRGDMRGHTVLHCQTSTMPCTTTCIGKHIHTQTLVTAHMHTFYTHEDTVHTDTCCTLMLYLLYIWYSTNNLPTYPHKLKTCITVPAGPA